MAKGRSSVKTELKLNNKKIRLNAKSRRKCAQPKHVPEKIVPQMSYRESHSVGRRQSTNVPTYSESGRLYYDLYVKYGLSSSYARKEEKSLFDSNRCVDLVSDVSDTSTVACNDLSVQFPIKRMLDLKTKKKKKLPKQIATDAQPSHSLSLFTRREASLNAEAKVNMLFESFRGSNLKKKITPITMSESKGNALNSIKSNANSFSPRKRGSHVRSLNQPPCYSPPKKRLAGLNAMAIISTFMKSPKPSSNAKSQPRRSRSTNSPCRSNKQNNFFVNVDGSSNSAINSSNHSKALTGPDSIIDAIAVHKTEPCSAVNVPTVERFQSRKVISYGTKCIGVENVSRQIIHVPSQNTGVPGTSCSSPVSQHPFIPALASAPSRVTFPVMPDTNALPHQNHSMVVIPDASLSAPIRPELFLPADIHTCFPNQLYVNPFCQIPALQPHALFVSPTLVHSMPPSPFHFLHASPFTATYMHSPPPFSANYMLPMPSSPIYDTFPHGDLGSCTITRTAFPNQPISGQAALRQAPLVYDLNSSRLHNSFVYVPPKRIDKAVSPMPETQGANAPSPASVAQVKKTPTKRLPLEKKQAQCSWVWFGTPTARLVFTKPDLPPVTRMCYPSMRHQKDGMVVRPGDNVLLCSGPDRHSAPHVAKVTALFNSPDNGTKMMALLWYYRPESLMPPRRSGVVECELFASRHCDVNPVDCIDDRAYVLSAAPYSRFMALAKYKQEARTHRRLMCVVPRIPTASSADTATNCTGAKSFAGDTSEFPDDATPSNVFLCRAWYDFCSRRVIQHLKSLNNNNNSSNTGAVTTSNKQHHHQQQQQQPVTSSPIYPPTSTSSVTISASSQPNPSLPLPSPKSALLSEEAKPVAAVADEEIPNGRMVLETTADLSINWGDHGEQIALSLGGAPLSPSAKKKCISAVSSPSILPADTTTSAPDPTPQSSHAFLS